MMRHIFQISIYSNSSERSVMAVCVSPPRTDRCKFTHTPTHTDGHFYCIHTNTLHVWTHTHTHTTTSRASSLFRRTSQMFGLWFVKDFYIYLYWHISTGQLRIVVVCSPQWPIYCVFFFFYKAASFQEQRPSYLEQSFLLKLHPTAQIVSMKRVDKLFRWSTVTRHCFTPSKLAEIQSIYIPWKNVFCLVAKSLFHSV